jgi:REP element-mobilizing transposase RayT
MNIIVDNCVNVLVHFVWAIWDRLPLIDAAWERDLHRYIHATCQNLDCHPLAVGGTEDHVHLLVTIPSTVRLADVMEAMKGSSSRLVASELAPHESFKWQGSYGAFSVSPRDKRMVIRYIQNQREHHAAGTTWASAGRSVAPAQAGARPRARVLGASWQGKRS